MNDFCVIGLGQAGSNIADEAAKLGILSGAINFSQKDLNSVNVKHKLRLSGSEGVGKNRDEAITLFQDQWKIASDFIQDNFSNVDLIVFAFSSSGGSGGGISPMLLDVMSSLMPEKIFISLVVIPEMCEATSCQINCLKTFEELSALNLAIFPIDNQQIRNQNPFIGKNKLFEISNKTSIALLFKLVSYTDKFSRNGNFDKKDFLTVLNTQGIATISEVEIMKLNADINLTREGVSLKVRESWSNTIFTPIETNKVTRAAIIFDGQEFLMEYLNHDLIFQDFKNGLPIDLFEGNYHEGNGKITTILTGLSWCNKRLNGIEESIKINQDDVESAFVTQVSYKSNTSDILNRIRKHPIAEKKKTMTDILSKYNR